MEHAFDLFVEAADWAGNAGNQCFGTIYQRPDVLPELLLLGCRRRFESVLYNDPNCTASRIGIVTEQPVFLNCDANQLPKRVALRDYLISDSLAMSRQGCRALL